MREAKYLQIKKKERSLALIDYIQEEDFFKYLINPEPIEEEESGTPT